MDGEAKSAPSRLVIRAPNWLGDAIMALPAMAVLRRAFPDASLTIAAPPSVAPLFHEQTSAGQDDILSLEGRDDARALAAGRFDAILLLPNSFRSAWLASRARIPDRWGYGGGMRGWLLTRVVRRPSGRVHQAEYYMLLVASVVSGSIVRLANTSGTVRLEPATDRRVPSEVVTRTQSMPDARITVRARTAERAEALLAREGIAPGTPLIGFAPGAAYGHAKRWPPRRVAGVVARLSAEHGATAVLVGAEGDRDAGREIESALPPSSRIVNLIGRTDLRLLAGVLARCSAFVSNDSGAVHLAAAIGVPVAAIFGPTDERVTSPLGNADILVHHVFCRPCMLRDCPIDHRCMKGISENAVFDVVSARLGASGSSPVAGDNP
ncbi:lipopolysaccharide heptosyltransferase II [soil metagenome]